MPNPEKGSGLDNQMNDSPVGLRNCSLSQGPLSDISANGQSSTEPTVLGYQKSQDSMGPSPSSSTSSTSNYPLRIVASPSSSVNEVTDGFGNLFVDNSSPVSVSPKTTVPQSISSSGPLVSNKSSKVLVKSNTGTSYPIQRLPARLFRYNVEFYYLGFKKSDGKQQQVRSKSIGRRLMSKLLSSQGLLEKQDPAYFATNGTDTIIGTVPLEHMALRVLSGKKEIQFTECGRRGESKLIMAKVERLQDVVTRSMESEFGVSDLVPGDSTIKALNIVLTKFAQAEGRFSVNGTLYGSQNLDLQRHRGFQIRQGVAVSIRMPQAESFTLDLQNHSNHFYPDGSLIDFVDHFCAQDPFSKDRLTLLQRMDKDRDVLEEVLKGLKVRYAYEPWQRGDASARAPGILPRDKIPTQGRVRTIAGIGGRAKDVFFTLEMDTGSERISVKDHFNRNVMPARKPLTHPEFPLINTCSVDKPVWIPMELLHIVANQPLCNAKSRMAPLPEYNDKRGIDHHPCSLMTMQARDELRREKAASTLDKPGYFKDFEDQRKTFVTRDGSMSDPSILGLQKLKDYFGIEISRTPKELYGHIQNGASIIGPRVVVEGNKDIDPEVEARKISCGRWTSLVPDSYRHWEKTHSIMCLEIYSEPTSNPVFVPSLENLITEMIKLKVLDWSDENVLTKIKTTVTRSYLPGFDRDVLKKALERRAYQVHPSSLLLVNINSKDKAYSSRLYAAIKRWSDTESGVRTLVVLDQSFKDLRVLEPGKHHTGTVHGEVASSKEQLALAKRYWLIRKVMAMQGSISHGVKGLDTLCEPDALDTMIVGASMSCAGVKAVPYCPSIATVVASVDGRFFKYCGSMRLQRADMDLEIVDLMDMMVERFKAWKAVNNDNKLTRIIYYRNGASEECFSSMKEKEMDSIRLAHEAVFPNAQHDPQIVYIALTKGRTRFTPSTPTNKNKQTPPTTSPIGLTVRPAQDHRNPHTLHPHVFHINTTPQDTTNHPPAPSTKYTILSDSSPQPRDRDRDPNHPYESLTHALCHLNPHAPRTLPLAAPAWHARRLARRGRCYIWDYLRGEAAVPAGAAVGAEGMRRYLVEGAGAGAWPGRGRRNPWVEALEGEMFWL